MNSMTRIVGYLSELRAADILAECELERKSVTVFGKSYPQPRLTQWYGPIEYAYSGIIWPAKAMPARIIGIADLICDMVGISFDCVLLNYYRDGQDGVGWHSDDEPIFSKSGAVASLSLGATRTFQLRRKDNHKEKVSLELDHGSVCVMPAGTQEEWQHQVPKTKTSVGPRLNLTFRQTNKMRHA